MWRLWLEAHGFAVLEANNGADALRQMEGEPPDLVLLDVLMPMMDGLETIRTTCWSRSGRYWGVGAGLRP